MATKQSSETKKQPTAKSKEVQMDILDSSPLETELLSVNPLLRSPIITIEEENEQKIEMIEEVQSLAVLNKQVLEAKRRQVELEVDNKKLDAAQKLIDGINAVADKALNAETISKILEKEDLNPMDLKFMAEAMDKMANTLKSLMNPSVQDEYGSKKRTKIIAAFQTASGDKMMMSTEVPGND
ncbi:hypothetical protein [Ruminiclostridium josui]|uniref:hypothetical protein n=1 Tax=Ruminiclostridium josui TaxID=1499 RepID=UPI000467A714|nr:hypothetical protein [Ruminiclostridium josui]